MLPQQPILDIEDHLDLIFFALADRTRRAILLAVSRGTRTVGELAAPHQMSLPAISKHLKILTRAGLVRKTKDGRIVHCDLNAAPLNLAAETIADYRHFWEDRFAGLEAFLAEVHKDGLKK